MMEKLLGLPELASEHGKDVDKLIIYIHYLMIALFVGWLAYFAYVLFRFHRSRSPKADYIGVKNHASCLIDPKLAPELFTFTPPSGFGKFQFIIRALMHCSTPALPSEDFITRA